jgi:ABC-2 type transport system permease protein
MIFLCGLFFPIENLPIWLRPISYMLPLTYGADALNLSINQTRHIPLLLSFCLLTLFCAALFVLSLQNIRKKWII